jgi:3'(2'), 5'-bisphosphate nucleotidase
MDYTNYQELTQIAIRASLAAGKAIMHIYNNEDFEVSFKENDSPLTKADRAGHNEIVAILAETGLPVLSEEGKDIPFDERKNWEHFWMVDPLDGTKEFIKRNGEFTVNIALIFQGKPVAGVVYVPVLNNLYWGYHGGGSWLKRLSEDKMIKLENSGKGIVKNIVASRSHMSKETKDFIDQYPDATTISMGSSLKFLLVAEGKAEIYPRFAPTMEWDTAAAHAIVENCGCEVLTYPVMLPMQYNKENLLNEWFLVRVL